MQLGIAGRDAEGRYDLCSLPAEKRTASPAVVYDEGFEQGTAGWTATEGMSARSDATAHGGKGCLLVSGTQSGKAWNYAQITLKQPVLPASRYRLSCWMHVDNIDAGAPAPYLKIGLSDAKGKWLTNIQTNSYDVARPGTWQRLVALVETTPNTAGGHLAIEKGNLEGRIAATIRLDDVTTGIARIAVIARRPFRSHRTEIPPMSQMTRAATLIVVGWLAQAALAEQVGVPEQIRREASSHPTPATRDARYRWRVVGSAASIPGPRAARLASREPDRSDQTGALSAALVQPSGVGAGPCGPRRFLLHILRDRDKKRGSCGCR